MLQLLAKYQPVLRFKAAGNLYWKRRKSNPPPGTPRAGLTESCGSLAVACAPSCKAKRAHVTAAHLVERVLPHVPYRQWTLSFPHRVRWVLLEDADGVFVSWPPRCKPPRT